jgi:hypothetical protein
MVLWDSSRRTGGRIAGPEVDRNSTRRSTESTKLDPWELSETEPPTKDTHKGSNEAGPRHIWIRCTAR